MDLSGLVPVLFLFTLGAVGVFSLVSKYNVEERKHDPNVPVSTLAKDGPQGGVKFLNPDALGYDPKNSEPVIE